eukprot:4017457-Amphidinium_carterae.1
MFRQACSWQLQSDLAKSDLSSSRSSRDQTKRNWLTQAPKISQVPKTLCCCSRQCNLSTKLYQVLRFLPIVMDWKEHGGRRSVGRLREPYHRIPAAWASGQRSLHLHLTCCPDVVQNSTSQDCNCCSKRPESPRAGKRNWELREEALVEGRSHELEQHADRQAYLLTDEHVEAVASYQIPSPRHPPTAVHEKQQCSVYYLWLVSCHRHKGHTMISMTATATATTMAVNDAADDDDDDDDDD